MAEEVVDPKDKKKKKKNIVLCPECDEEVDVDEEDECSSCGLNVKIVMDKDRYDRALQRLRERREAENPDKKKKKSGSGGSWNPFG